jgi:hypothetical protein
MKHFPRLVVDDENLSAPVQDQHSLDHAPQDRFTLFLFRYDLIEVAPQPAAHFVKALFEEIDLITAAMGKCVLGEMTARQLL